MAEMPASTHVEVRGGGYYVAGTRIGLDLVVRDFQEGKSPEEILQRYPSVGSLSRIYGAITFILEHPEAVQAYLEDQDRLWEELKQRNPLSPDTIERFYRARELTRKPA